MTQEQFYHEAVIAAMQGLLAASGHYRDELIKNPCGSCLRCRTIHMFPMDSLRSPLFGMESL
jgi:hypothetical protein